METIDQIRLAKQAKKSINTATSADKNKALRAMADAKWLPYPIQWENS